MKQTDVNPTQSSRISLSKLMNTESFRFITVGAATGAIGGITALTVYGLLTGKGAIAALAAKTSLGLQSSGLAGIANTAATTTGASTVGAAATNGAVAATSVASGGTQALPKLLNFLIPASAGAVGGGASGLSMARQAVQKKLQEATSAFEAQANDLLQRVQSLETFLEEDKATPATPATPTNELEQIKGIGPKFAKLLQEIGIYTLEDLAKADINALEIILDNSPAKQMFKLEDWIEQAKAVIAARNQPTVA